MTEGAAPAAYAHNGAAVSAEDFYAIACDPRRNVAVEACAGAGKTWMLVSRIVRSLLDGTDSSTGDGVAAQEILAITFTKRAASEMRERLYRWLEDFSAAPQDVLAQELRSRGVRAEHDLKALGDRLSGLYAQLLVEGRPVQIRTFHSWFAALLRAAPLALLQQLELPLHYELLEDDTAAKKLVWRRFYQALLAQPQCRADFEALVRDHGRSQTEKALSGALDKRVEFALADAHAVVDQSVQHFHAMFPDLAGVDHPAQALDLAQKRARWLAWAVDLGRQSTKTPQKAARAVIDAFRAPDAAPDASAAGAAARLAALRKAFFVADEDRLIQHLTKFDAAQQAAVELGRLCAAAHQHAAWMYQRRMARLARVLVAEFSALKRERGWVDMPDVERAALILLSDPVLSGWVLERLDTRVRHLLIDEFQDTNPLQWQALLSWLGSYSGASSATPSVFIVGDPKQSIYRFRRAEPQVFRAAQDFIAQGLGGDLLSCDHTRRSSTQVMATVNAVMATARANDGYDGFREHSSSSVEIGLAARLPAIPRASVVAAFDAGDPADRPWRDSLSGARELPEETLRTLEARQIARCIASACDAGLLPSDVMVLSRRRAGLLPLQDELRALQIPAQIGEKTALIDCCEVQDLVALLDVLVSPQHDLSLARALRSPLFDAPDAALVALARERREQGLPWFELLQQDWSSHAALAAAGATLLRWKDWLDRLPPHDALQAIYSDGDVLARFAVRAPAPQRDAVLANLQALLGASLQLAGGRFVTPYAFVRALNAGGVMAPATVTENAVRLLTVHGAKGLEAHTVVLADTDTPTRVAQTMAVLVDWPGEAQWPRKFVFLANETRPPMCARQTLAFEHAQREREELNALYVALTRARNTLLVSSIAPHRAAPTSWWQRLVTLIRELPPADAEASPRCAGSDRPGPAFELLGLPAGRVNAAATDPAQVPASDDQERARPGEQDLPAARIGRAMHRLLEWGDFAVASTAAVAREFELDAQQAELAAQVAGRIRGGSGAWAWDDAVLAWQANEVELVYHGDTLRIDRLVRRRDTGQWWVLDYKSTHTPQEDADLVAQLQTYQAAVQAIYPGDSVRAAFLNGHGSLIELPAGAGGL